MPATQSQSGVTKSPYEPGVYFVRGQTWQIGDRYELLKQLGTGSFSEVCLATDRSTGDKVAVKRIPDVLSSPEQAKRVLREICILRRLTHPFIIELKNAFVQPSATGPSRLINGQLVSSSVDVYIVFEYCELGDLFHYRGQLASDEVQLLLWQILHVLKYLHANNVWHRDLKSANVLVKLENGQRIIKVADFGSARFATQEGYHFAEQHPPERAGEVLGSLETMTAARQTPRASQDMEAGSKAAAGSSADLYIRPGKDARANHAAGIQAPLTGVVATPCYRAPERVAGLGAASTPQLQVAPMFAIQGKPKTPSEGEVFGAQAGPGNSTTQTELQALFDIIGTPHWADVEALQLPAWKKYLQRLPGKAPTLYRHLGSAGEAAVHLLGRLLAFDPARRCSAEEALTHEYLLSFEAIDTQMAIDAKREEELENLLGVVDGMDLDGSKRVRRPTVLDLKSAVEAAEQQNAKRLKAGSLETPELQHTESQTAPLPRHYYDEPDPAKALDMLEAELATICPMAGLLPQTYRRNQEQDLHKLRLLLERECAAQARQSPACTPLRGPSICIPPSRRGSSMTHPLPSYLDPNNVLTAWGSSAAQLGLQEDVGALYAARDPEEYGRARLSHVADTWKGKLDPAEYLNPGRHGEWTTASGMGCTAGPTWGVSSSLPGAEKITDPRVREAIRNQQLR
ncbi:MAG: MAPK-related kinase [Trebouxia sp. A1-2]|nr:MAG: MAPK-related kinase [Trebouxia sp. A1-2]